jgi:drug/metabolite transporter (DMT)-like permease
VTREREGLFLCLASAAGFGAMAIFAKKGYEAGLDVTTLLALRFVLAATLLWALVGAARRGLGDPRALAVGAALGIAGYSVQAGLYFSALTRISAGLTSLLLYAYPALVTVAAIALRRDTADRRRIGALLIATGGVALVLVGGGLGGDGGVDPVGALMALGAAGAYTVYILVSDGWVNRAASLPFAASVCTGAALSVSAVALLKGPSDITGEGLGWVAGLAIFSTVMPIVLFFRGLERVGPSTASILSTIEPPVTVGLAWLVFGETLGALQLTGGVLVLSAVVLLQWRRSASSSRSSAGSSPEAWTSERQSPRSAPAASQAQVSATVSDSGRGRSPASRARPADIA